MQRHLDQFESELKDSLDEIWTKPLAETPVDSWALRMTEAEKDRKVDPADKVPKPELPGSGWKVILFYHGVV